MGTECKANEVGVDANELDPSRRSYGVASDIQLD